MAHCLSARHNQGIARLDEIDARFAGAAEHAVVQRGDAPSRVARRTGQATIGGAMADRLQSNDARMAAREEPPSGGVEKRLSRHGGLTYLEVPTLVPAESAAFTRAASAGR